MTKTAEQNHILWGRTKLHSPYIPFPLPRLKPYAYDVLSYIKLEYVSENIVWLPT